MPRSSGRCCSCSGADAQLRVHWLCLCAVRVNETDTFADEDGANDEYFDFEDISGKHIPFNMHQRFLPAIMVRSHQAEL